MDISELIKQLIAKSPGVKYDPNSSGAIKTELLHQEIKKNGIMFKKSVEYLAHCLKAHDIETIQRKKHNIREKHNIWENHNMLEINFAIASINRYKSRFFMLLAVEEVFNEFFQEFELNVPEINIKDLNIKELTRLSKSGSRKTLKNKKGGSGRGRGRMTRKLSVRRNKKLSMFKFLLMLMSILNLVSAGAAGGEPDIIIDSPVGLYMRTKISNLASEKSEYTKVSVGFPYPTKGSEQEKVFTTGDQLKIPGPSTILLPEIGEYTIPFTTIKLSKIENAISTWAASSDVIPATKEEQLSNTMASMTNEFNSISDIIQKKVKDLCTNLVTEVQLNKIFNENKISDLAEYKFIPETSSTTYYGSTTITDSTEIHTFFTSTDLISYMRKLCSVPELRLEDPFLNEDGTYTIALTRFGIPHAEELFSNLTIAVGEHLSKLTKESEGDYNKEMLKKGIKKIESGEYSLVTKDSIRRIFLLNLQEKFSLYKILIDNIVSEQQSLSEIFAKTNKGSKVSDITTPEVLQKFLDSIQAKNKNILKDLERTLISEEFLTKTPYTLKEFKNTEILVEAQIKTLKQMELLKQDNLEQQMRLIEERRKQQEINLNASRTEKLYEQTVNKETMSGYMNTFFSYGEGIGAPIYDTAGKLLGTGSEGIQSLLKGAGDLLGGGINNILVGLCGGLFGTWGWLAGLTFFSAVPIMFCVYLSWKIGGIRLVKGGVNLGFGLVTYLPRKILIAIFSRRSNGSIASQGIITFPNPQNLIPGSRNLPMLGAPGQITEITSSEARRINNPEDAERNISRRRLERETRAAEARAAELRAAEANRNETATDVARREAATAVARSRAGYFNEQSRLRNLQTEVGGRRYRKRTYKRKHNKRNRRSRRK